MSGSVGKKGDEKNGILVTGTGKMVEVGNEMRWNGMERTRKYGGQEREEVRVGKRI
jgi:hypothetical protein